MKLLETIIGKVLNVLFHERIKAAMLTGYKLTECKEQPCSWKELYESHLKKLRVSQKTLASILKAWEKTGVIKKVKAPFPYRSKYKLIKEDPVFELMRFIKEKIHARSNTQRVAMETGNFNLLRETGKEAMEEWEFITKQIYLTLLERGLEARVLRENESEPSEHEIAFLCFFLVDYLLHSVAHLFGESREEVKNTLLKYMKDRFVETEKRFDIERVEKIILEDALTLKP